jgi:hypothetical protein
MTWLLIAAALYATLGLFFALWFSLRGVQRMDPAAVGASLAFRLLILPGATALWPWLLSAYRGRS